VTGHRLTYAPEHLLNLTLGYSHPRGIDGFIEAVRVGSQFADDLNSLEPSADGQRGLIPGNTTWNLTINIPVEPWHSTMFVAVKNLLNQTFIVDRSRGILPNNPRLIESGMKFRF
jgi:Fe(3+) dicitrate transport protein